MTPGVTTRLKVLAKLDIAERRKPQDGRISLNAQAAGRMLDIRVATLPTVDGEKVVMRLLDKSRRAPTLEELGLSDEMRDRLAEILKRPTGALLVTGPTGSGKSTTLYAGLTTINRPEVNIITVEDPVEYRLAGVNQVQINNRAGLTFASALRSILRSDPDVVMVGEIRDGETAKISIEAALTGHFVLSTLHTNDAPSAITRLNEMGVEPFLTGAAVTGVLAQRLARKLCAHCCEMYQPSTEELLSSRVVARGRARLRRHGLPPQARLPALQPDRLQGPRRHLPAADDERDDRAARGRPREPRGGRAGRDRRRACAPSGTTAWRRSRPASRRSKSSRASSSDRAAAVARTGRLEPSSVCSASGRRYWACTSQPRIISASTASVTKLVACWASGNVYGPGWSGSDSALPSASGRPRPRPRRSRRSRPRGGRRRSVRPCARAGRTARASRSRRRCSRRGVCGGLGDRLPVDEAGELQDDVARAPARRGVPGPRDPRASSAARARRPR